MLIFKISGESDYDLPARPGDVIAFTVDKLLAVWRGDTVTDLRIGIIQDGEVIHEDIGTIADGDTDIYCALTVPQLENGCYQIIIYSIYDPTDCSQFNGLTLQQTIDTGTVLGDALQCTLNDFL